MTLLLLDGCEDLSSWVASTGGNPIIVAGRNGNCFRLPISATPPAVMFPVPTSDQTDTITVGFAARSNNLSFPFTLVDLRSDAGATQHNRISFTNTGQIAVTRGGTTIGTTTGAAMSSDNWYFIEATIKLHDTAGTVDVWINGVNRLSLTAVDTKNGGTKTVYDTVALYAGPSAGIQQDVDDLYIANDATRFGDIRVETLYPNGDGSVNQWVGSDGDSASNYALVNEAGTPNTATYSGSGVIGNRDIYQLGNLASATGAVRGVCHAVYAAKSDSGARQLKVLNQGGSISASPTLTLSTSFAGYHYGLTTSPDTGQPFTIAEVNALQSGVEVA